VFAACAYLLRHLLAPIVWAGLIAVASWPLHDRLRRVFSGRSEITSAVVLTLAVVLFLVVPFSFLLFRGLHEMPALLQLWHDSEAEGISAPAWLAKLPGIGEWATRQWTGTLAEPGALAGYAHSMFHGMDFAAGRTLVMVVGRHAMALFFCVVVLFFIYLGGDALAAQIDAVLARHIGPAGMRTGALAVRAVRGAVNGLVLVGLGLAVIMSAAYAIAGAAHPFLWGLATGFLGMIPFGAMVVLVGAVLFLMAAGSTSAALWLGIFGAAAIFIADHFVRPVFMSGASKLPLVLALLGIVGGVETFGILGLFLGPTLLAVMVAVWRELAAPRRPAAGVAVDVVAAAPADDTAHQVEGRPPLAAET
ncbi:MAG: AI-2E family transporter, partial [Pseudomonadota bacterium]|nr:AI-2E family transporter [Pseudomonadota bacterium]